ncbi:MAG: hypothetical protein R2769_17500 [Saprospiraceae bacterium]
MGKIFLLIPVFWFQLLTIDAQNIDYERFLHDATNAIGKPFCHPDVEQLAVSLGKPSSYFMDLENEFKEKDPDFCKTIRENSTNFKDTPIDKENGIFISFGHQHAHCHLFIKEVNLELFPEENKVNKNWSAFKLKWPYHSFKMPDIYTLKDFRVNYKPAIDHYETSLYNFVLSDSESKSICELQLSYDPIYGDLKELLACSAMGIKKIKSKDKYLTSVVLREERDYHQYYDSYKYPCQENNEPVFLDWGDEKVSEQVATFTAYLNNIGQARRDKLEIPNDVELVKKLFRNIMKKTEEGYHVLSFDEVYAMKDTKGEFNYVPDGKLKKEDDLYLGKYICGIAHGKGLITNDRDELKDRILVVKGNFVLGHLHGTAIFKKNLQKDEDGEQVYYEYGIKQENIITLQKDGYTITGNDGETLLNGGKKLFTKMDSP